jgi:hypothetical protein
MNATTLMLPRFSRNQTVQFSGGVGTIKSYQPNSNNTWTYAIEMELGPEPIFGRVGFETTILLLETEIHEYSGSHVDEVQSSGFSGIGNWELGIGKKLKCTSLI